MSGRRRAIEKRMQPVGRSDRRVERPSHGSVLHALGRDGAEAIELAQIARLAERSIDGRDRRPLDRLFTVDLKMRRTQQRDERRARELGRGELEDDVERGGERFGGKRQRVEGLIRNPGAAEDIAREIQVRQRASEDDADALERRTFGGRFDAARDGDELFFAVAVRKHGRVGRARRCQENRQDPRALQTERSLVDLLDARQPFVDALVEARLQHLDGRDDVERFQRRDTCQQVEIGPRETVGIGNPVGDRDDDVTSGIGGLGRDQAVAQRVLVDKAAGGKPPFVRTKNGGQKSRLLDRPRRAAIEIDVGREAVRQQLLESGDCLALAPQLIVEPHDFGDKAGPQVKRRVNTRLGRRRANDRLALVPRKPSRRRCEALAEPVVQFVARDDFGKDGRADRARRPVFERGAQLSSCCRRGDDNEPRTRGLCLRRRRQRVGSTQRHDGAPEPMEGGDAHQPRPARRDLAQRSSLKAQVSRLKVSQPFKIET